ncbi:hypothetical protein LR48_Vigan08g126200 [Vigna angularis]|uniref:Uncharacterized protein n=1 Tax=Phaseolus angularis TaxID=3914 RepID=A0A0L9V5U7_PHAAN|nr:hypothetical protein LR48_Vigan08g126200 [Vigna angularis]
MDGRLKVVQTLDQMDGRPDGHPEGRSSTCGRSSRRSSRRTLVQKIVERPQWRKEADGFQWCFVTLKVIWFEGGVDDDSEGTGFTAESREVVWALHAFQMADGISADARWGLVGDQLRNPYCKWLSDVNGGQWQRVAIFAVQTELKCIASFLDVRSVCRKRTTVHIK